MRVPHKPLLLLWVFGQFAATGSSAASYQQAEEPVSQLINDFGPPVASSAAARQRGAMPFDAWHKGCDDFGEELADVAIYLLGLAEMTGVGFRKADRRR